jgi:hypothetical protein
VFICVHLWTLTLVTTNAQSMIFSKSDSAVTHNLSSKRN